MPVGKTYNLYTSSWNALVFALFFCYLISVTHVCSEPSTATTQKCRNVTSQIIVNETKEEWCAGVFVNCYLSGTCYCNTTSEVAKIHTTIVCEDDNKEEESKTSNVFSGLRKLSDAELAAIAVIASLVFSIIISITVFFIQRRHRACVRRKADQQPSVVEVKEGDAEEPGEGAQFLPPSADGKYIHVKAANAQYSVVVTEDKANCDDGCAMVKKPDMITSSTDGEQQSSSEYSAATSSKLRKHAPSQVALGQPPQRNSATSSTQTDPCDLTPFASPRKSDLSSPGVDGTKPDSPPPKSPAPTSSTESDVQTSTL